MGDTAILLCQNLTKTLAYWMKLGSAAFFRPFFILGSTPLSHDIIMKNKTTLSKHSLRSSPTSHTTWIRSPQNGGQVTPSSR